MSFLTKFAVVLAFAAVLSFGLPSKAELPFRFDGSTQVDSSYIYRGYEVVDTGLITENYLNLSLNPISCKDWSFVPHMGMFLLAGDMDSVLNSDGTNVNEIRGTIGTEVKYKCFTFDLTYSYRGFSDDSQDDVQELGLVTSYSDNGFGILPFAVNPFFGVYQELDRETNTYAELGVMPKFQLTKNLSLTVPVKLGMSFNGYYEDVKGSDDFFGYASVSTRLQYNFTKHWNVFGEVEYNQFLADVLKDVNGSDHEFVGKVGIGFSY